MGRPRKASSKKKPASRKRSFRPSPAPDESALRQILELVRQDLGVDLSDYKPTTVQRRIERQMSLSRVGNLAAYARLLQDKPEARQDLLSDLFIHVTEFFRDPEAFRPYHAQEIETWREIANVAGVKAQ